MRSAPRLRPSSSKSRSARVFYWAARNRPSAVVIHNRTKWAATHTKAQRH